MHKGTIPFGIIIIFNNNKKEKLFLSLLVIALVVLCGSAGLGAGSQVIPNLPVLPVI
jgi:hypothetical protein